MQLISKSKSPGGNNRWDGTEEPKRSSAAWRYSRTVHAQSAHRSAEEFHEQILTVELATIGEGRNKAQGWQSVGSDWTRQGRYLVDAVVRADRTKQIQYNNLASTWITTVDGKKLETGRVCWEICKTYLHLRGWGELYHWFAVFSILYYCHSGGYFYLQLQFLVHTALHSRAI